MRIRIREAIDKSMAANGDVVVIQTQSDAEFDGLELFLKDAADDLEELDDDAEYGLSGWIADEDGVVEWHVKLLHNLDLR